MFVISTYCCLCTIYWSQVFMNEDEFGEVPIGDATTTSWVINNFIAYWCVTYIKGLRVVRLGHLMYYQQPLAMILIQFHICAIQKYLLTLLVQIYLTGYWTQDIYIYIYIYIYKIHINKEHIQCQQESIQCVDIHTSLSEYWYTIVHIDI